jgi:uncharacterized protein (DUF58 family)
MNIRAWFKRQTRKRIRVFIIPTRMGGYLNGLIFLMMLLSVGYSNNLLLIFTLILFGFNLMWVVQSNYHLHHLKFDHLQVPHGFSGSLVQIVADWKSAPGSMHEWNLVIESEGEDLTVRTLEQTHHKLVGEVSLPSRGLKRWKYLRVSSTRPYGLYYAWTFYPLEVSSYVFPPLLSETEIPDLRVHDIEGEITSQGRGHDELRDLAPYQGEESRKISWKHYARSGELLIKEGSELKNAILHLRLKLPETVSAKEVYLSRLATQMMLCHRREIPFIFETPTSKRGPSFTQSHLYDCLKELAVC